MKPTRRHQILNLVLRGLSFIFVFSLGTIVALLIDEASGLALTDLSKASIQTMTVDTSGRNFYAVLNESSQPAGIYRSDDRGRTWQFVGSGPEDTINALVVHPTNQTVLFAGTPGGPVASTNNLWRSDDGGQSWHKFFPSLPARPGGLIPAVTTLAIDPHRPDILYVGTAGQGVYSFDVGPQGYGYSLVGKPAASITDIERVGVGPDHKLYALAENGLFVTAGGDWHKIDSLPETPISLATSTTEPQTIYIAASSGNVYRSIDSGQTWRQIGGDWWSIPGTMLHGTVLAVDQQNANHVVFTTAYEVDDQMVGGSIYETHDAGQNWVKVSEAHGVVKQLVIDSQTIYAAAPTGLVRYKNLNEPEPSGFMAGLRMLFNLTRIQMLVLVLTLGLALLVLLGRIESRIGWEKWRHLFQ